MLNMKVATKECGILELDERQKITFPAGLLGFESLKDYVLHDAEQQPFYWLQSLDTEKVAFILLNPYVFRPDYESDFDNDELKMIGLKDSKNALVFSIVTIPPEGGIITANLQGPLIINKENHQGIQAVLTDARWTTKHDIQAELKAAGKGK
jgi:flagellar assembly factor FliW